MSFCLFHTSSCDLSTNLHTTAFKVTFLRLAGFCLCALETVAVRAFCILPLTLNFQHCVVGSALSAACLGRGAASSPRALHHTIDPRPCCFTLGCKLSSVGSTRPTGLSHLQNPEATELDPLLHPAAPRLKSSVHKSDEQNLSWWR